MQPQTHPTQTSSDFDADYYERGLETGKSCYRNYRWLPELTVPMAEAICKHAGIRCGDSVLDFGCAKGFLVRALRMLGREAWGVDISLYALGCATAEVRPYVTLAGEGDEPFRLADGGHYQHAIAKDVLEHVDPADIEAVCMRLARSCRHLFVVVPVGDGERFTIEDYEKDVTHRIRQPAEWWAERFRGHFQSVEVFAHCEGIKDNWFKVDPAGNAVIKCNFSTRA